MGIFDDEPQSFELDIDEGALCSCSDTYNYSDPLERRVWALEHATRIAEMCLDRVSFSQHPPLTEIAGEMMAVIESAAMVLDAGVEQGFTHIRAISEQVEDRVLRETLDALHQRIADEFTTRDQ